MRAQHRITLSLFTLALLGACGTAEVVTTADSTSVPAATAAATSSTAATNTASTAAQTTVKATTTVPPTTLAPTTTTTLPAGVGSTITLKHSDGTLAVTVTEFVDPIAPTSEYSKPEEGKHYVAVRVRVVNTGPKVWSDSLTNGAKLVDDKRQEYRSSFSSAVKPSFSSSVVDIGDTRLGWVVFEVPDGTVIARFTLALDSGFADQTGQWLVGTGAPADPAPPVKPAATAVGQTITLPGREVKMGVTLREVVDNAPPENAYSKPADGYRFFAAQFEFANVGAVAYDDSPTNGMALIDASGQTWTTTFSDTAAGPGFEGGLTIAPADSRVGFVVFEIPVDAVPAKLQVTLDSGFANTTGEWQLALG